MLSFTSLVAAVETQQAVLRRSHVRSGYILTRFALHIVLIAFGSTWLVCFLSHFCLPFSFSPAAFADSSPRIFEAAMNLTVETTCQPSDGPASREMRRRCRISHALICAHPSTIHQLHLLSPPYHISHPTDKSKGEENGQLTHPPTTPPSPARTRPAQLSYRPDSPYQPGAHLVAPIARVDGCIVCCG